MKTSSYATKSRILKTKKQNGTTAKGNTFSKSSKPRVDFELVEFYPLEQPVNGTLGTVHIYLAACNLDLRGIGVKKAGKGLFFVFPHFWGVDEETGKPVKYPFFRWTNERKQKEMMHFLQTTVKAEILKRISQ